MSLFTSTLQTKRALWLSIFKMYPRVLCSWLHVINKSMLINKKEREKEEWKCRYTVVPCSEVTGINEKDNGFLGSGPISSHLLTARPRGRIYSPPGDHSHPLFTLLRPQAKVPKNTVSSSFTSHFSKDRFTSTQFVLDIFLTSALQHSFLSLRSNFQSLAHWRSW